MGDFGELPQLISIQKLNPVSFQGIFNGDSHLLNKIVDAEYSEIEMTRKIKLRHS